MLQVDLEDVLDLEHLAHPAWAEVHGACALILVAVAVLAMQTPLGRAVVPIDDGARGSIHDISRFVAAVLFKGWDLELEVLLLAGVGLAAIDFLRFQIGDALIVVARLRLPAPHQSVQLEFVRPHIIAALGIVAVNVDIDHIAWVVDVLGEADLHGALGGAEKAHAHRRLHRELECAIRDLLGGLEDLNLAATSKQRHIPVHAWQQWMVHVEGGFPWGELCSDRVLYHESISTRLVSGGLGEPRRGVDLEGVGVLAGLQALTLRELHNDLLHRDELFLLDVVRLELLGSILLNGDE